MNWSNITLKKYLQIQDILSVEDDYTLFNLIDVIYDVDSQSLPISEVKKYDISFMGNKIPKAKLKDKYTLNGTTYKSNLDLTKVTAAQFIDYQNYIKEQPLCYEKLLSVFFIPKGCEKYNTGYDISKVQQDVLELPIDVVHTISFFFSNQLHLFLMLFPFYLIQQVEKMEMPTEKKQMLIKSIKEMDSLNSESFRTFLNIAK